ncbi:MAG: D-aminoacyl-tRNA deacylase [Patescibacteria group bacterium]|nr:D-aminoacyl-tRNA deacylase [Patescibacteria group bacterium]MCL5257858.1 D-aminoacyl-tRNA deacylase [Patescibacteria group bacterium]
MKLVLQSVAEAKVETSTGLVAQIKKGLLIFVCFEVGDDEEKVNFFAAKLPNLKVFADAQGKINLSIEAIKGEFLIVSQFTLTGKLDDLDFSFSSSLAYAEAEKLYNKFIEMLKKSNRVVRSGQFGEMMDISLVNVGPLTFVLSR